MNSENNQASDKKIEMHKLSILTGIIVCIIGIFVVLCHGPYATEYNQEPLAKALVIIFILYFIDIVIISVYTFKNAKEINRVTVEENKGKSIIDIIFNTFFNKRYLKYVIIETILLLIPFLLFFYFLLNLSSY